MTQVESKGQWVLLGYGPANHKDDGFFDWTLSHSEVGPRGRQLLHHACIQQVGGPGEHGLRWKLEGWQGPWLTILGLLDKQLMNIYDISYIYYFNSYISCLMFFSSGILNTKSVLAADHIEWKLWHFHHYLTRMMHACIWRSQYDFSAKDGSIISNSGWCFRFFSPPV